MSVRVVRTLDLQNREVISLYYFRDDYMKIKVPLSIVQCFCVRHNKKNLYKKRKHKFITGDVVTLHRITKCTRCQKTLDKKHARTTFYKYHKVEHVSNFEEIPNDYELI